MYGTGRLSAATASLTVAVFVAMTPTAQADTQRGLSEPNGDIFVTSSSGATTDRDRDGDFNTVTKTDNGNAKGVPAARLTTSNSGCGPRTGRPAPTP